MQPQYYREGERERDQQHISHFVCGDEMMVAVRFVGKMILWYVLHVTHHHWPFVEMKCLLSPCSCKHLLLFIHRSHREPAAETSDRLWWGDRETVLWNLWPGGFPQNTRSTGRYMCVREFDNSPQSWSGMYCNNTYKNKATNNFYKIANTYKYKISLCSHSRNPRPTICNADKIIDLLALNCMKSELM